MARESSRRNFLVSAGAVWELSTRNFSFHVFGLLKPRTLVLSAGGPSRAIVTASSKDVVLEGARRFEVDSSSVPLHLCGTAGEPVSFMLEAPSLLRRGYFGTLTITESEGVLMPVVFMDRETAVSSIVGAELPVSEAPFEALAVQAIVARSFLAAAGRRHNGWDFCDTSHCQFLRSPAPQGSLSGKSTKRTQAMTLKSGGQTVAARYSAACGGRTEQKLELGYLYQSVACEVCQEHRYPRRGHGLGLCQEGTMEFARRGWSYARILAKYFPATQIA